MKDFDASGVIPLAEKFMKDAKAEGKPFFVWLDTSRMHLYTRLNDKWFYAAKQNTIVGTPMITDQSIHHGLMVRPRHFVVKK